MNANSNTIEFTHVIDLARVNFVNIAAISLSLTDVEQWVRLLGMVVALVYTTAKTVQLIREMMEKSSVKKRILNDKE